MTEPRYLRKVIRIAASDSPNVRAKRNVLKGVLSWEEYQERMLTWDVVRRTVGLDGEFYEGAEVLMFPSEWLAHAEELAGRRVRPSGGKDLERFMGVDPAEGGDHTAWAIGDRFGLLHLLAMKTPDTKMVAAMTIALIRQWDVPAENVCLDRGNGGRIHVDRLHELGFKVDSVAFGESVTPPLTRRGLKPLEQRVDERDDRTTYKNRRAAMYGTLMSMVDPSLDGWAMPKRLLDQVPSPGRRSLREQLNLIPKTYDGEGKLYVIPKTKPGQELDENGRPKGQDTLVGIIGHSPDEADAVVVMVHRMTTKPVRATAGVG